MEADPKRIKPAYVLGVHGLELVIDFITIEEEQRLLESIEQEEWNTSISRRTQHYGFLYDYTTKGAAQKTKSLPEWSVYVIDRLMERGFLTERPDQMIVNEYLPGKGIAPHVDNTKWFADGIVSISLESEVVMDFSKNNDPSVQKELVLPQRSALILHSDARYDWRHGIAARKTDHGKQRGRRVSMTFRKMK